MSRFGRWIDVDGLPAFEYLPDPAGDGSRMWDPIVAPRTSRHWIVIGNRRINAVVDNIGTVALFDESEGLRWITAPDPGGTGESLLEGRPTTIKRVVFGPMSIAVDIEADGLALTRTVVVPEGEQPWVVVHVAIHNTGGSHVALDHIERWAVRPRCLNLGVTAAAAEEHARAAAGYEIEAAGGRVVATERPTPAADELAQKRRPRWFGSPVAIVLEALDGAPGTASARGERHPVLEIRTPLSLAAGATHDLWFRFGIDEGAAGDDPDGATRGWAAALAGRLPRATCERVPLAAREVPWHAALLSGGACRDVVLGGHTLDQGSAYSYTWGFNGAARDPLQHALPLVYSEPDLALSVLRNTCAWGSPDGALPYGLDGAKRPWTDAYDPSDLNLWALWLAAEYAAATGDLAAFAAPVGYHPIHSAAPVTLQEHLRRQLGYLVERVGTGERGHLRIMNADWNDNVLITAGVPRDVMIEHGESVLGSAMAAWVLPVYAGLCDRLGDTETAGHARTVADGLRDAVRAAWNGRWFQRAFAPGAPPVGDDDLWLECQPWAILCGAATTEQALTLLDGLDATVRAGSPLGARVRWPLDVDDGTGTGCATNGGIWPSINATLVWAAAAIAPDFGWDEWERMTLAAHERAYPNVWEGTLSGPDAYNSPESDRPGRTWAVPAHGLAMQAFPVGNFHSHAQPLLGYLRLLGVEPAGDGALVVRGAVPEAGAAFTSATFSVGADGSGRLSAKGPVVVDTPTGRISGGPGDVVWPGA